MLLGFFSQLNPHQTLFSIFYITFLVLGLALSSKTLPFFVMQLLPSDACNMYPGKLVNELGIEITNLLSAF